MKEKKPKNLEECLNILSVNFKKGSWTEFQNMSEEDAITSCHHYTGQNMRNNWGLWEDTTPLVQWFNRIGIKHADDMSSIILATFHRRLNGVDEDLDGQVEEYKEYWKNAEKGIIKISKGSNIKISGKTIKYKRLGD